MVRSCSSLRQQFSEQKIDIHFVVTTIDIRQFEKKLELKFFVGDFFFFKSLKKEIHTHLFFYLV